MHGLSNGMIANDLVWRLGVTQGHRQHSLSVWLQYAFNLYFNVEILPLEAMLSVVYAVVVCLSVCLCVCHTPVLYQNG